MARDPNALKYPESWVDSADDLKKLPTPTGTSKPEWDAKIASGDYYANVKVYQDGRRVVEWYQRNAGGGPGKPDPVQSTSNDVMPTVKEEWDKEEDKPPATRVINGVPHQVTGKDANGQDIWSPVQTSSGVATATTAPKPTNVYIGTNPMTGKPSEVSEWPDGRKTYDDTNVPAAASGDAKPPTTEDRGGRHYVWKPNAGGPNAGGQWVDAGTAPETPAERQAREANAPTQSVSRETGGDGKPYTVITIVPKPGQPGKPGQIVLGPDGQPAPNGIPGKPPKEDRKTVTINGKPYIEVSVQRPDGTSDLYHTDQSGNRVTLPSEGQATAGGPPMPQIVVGQSQEALKKYWDALAADPSLTPKQRADYFQQAVQTANIAVQEAATQQRERESTRNFEYNVAGTRLNAMQSGLTQALDFASKMNATLPEGSDLGGKAFMAVLGLQLLQMERSGINGLGKPATPSADQPAVPTIAPADLTNPERLEAKRAEIMANPVFRPQAEVGATNVLGAGAVGDQPAPSSVPAAGGASYKPEPLDNVPTPPPATPPANAQAAANAGPVPGQDGSVWQPPAPPSPPALDYGAPGMRVLPQPSQPSSYGGGTDTPVSMAPGSDFAVLQQPAQGSLILDPARMAQSAAWRSPMQLDPAQYGHTADEPLPAELHTMASTLPPWRIDEALFQKMRAAGVPDETIMSVPGR